MVCAVIGFLGFIKPFTFDHIKNKYVRKTSLYFASIVFAFAATAIAFWVKDWNFVYYWLAGAGMACATIIVYSLYEGTNLKLVVDNVNSRTWEKWLGIKAKNVEELKEGINSLLSDLSLANPKKAVEKKHDKELENL